MEGRLTRQSSSPCPSSVAVVAEPVGIGPGEGTSFAVAEEGHSWPGEDSYGKRSVSMFSCVIFVFGLCLIRKSKKRLRDIAKNV